MCSYVVTLLPCSPRSASDRADPVHLTTQSRIGRGEVRTEDPNICKLKSHTLCLSDGNARMYTCIVYENYHSRLSRHARGFTITAKAFRRQTLNVAQAFSLHSRQLQTTSSPYPTSSLMRGITFSLRILQLASKLDATCACQT